MSFASKVLGKKPKARVKKKQQYDNPKKNGLYRICFWCETMFPIDSIDAKGALCWDCTRIVLRSGHYLASHITLPKYKETPKPIWPCEDLWDYIVEYPGHCPEDEVVEKRAEETISTKPEEPKTVYWKLCSRCGKAFKLKTGKERICPKCRG